MTVIHVQLHQHNWNTARNLSSYVTVHTFMYKLQRCQKILPFNCCWQHNQKRWREGAYSNRLFSQAPVHQYNGHSRACPCTPYFHKISLSSLNSCWSEQSTCGQGEQRHRSSVQVALAVLPLLAMRQETGQGYFESFPTFLAWCIKCRFERRSRIYSSSWAQLEVRVVEKKNTHPISKFNKKLNAMGVLQWTLQPEYSNDTSYSRLSAACSPMKNYNTTDW